MKNVFYSLLIAVLATQCTDSKTEITTTTDDVGTSEVKVLSEELRPYALTAIDSVYSIKCQFTSADSVVAVYKASLTQGDQVFTDSLILAIPAGEVVQGELIFPACRVKNKPQPQLNANFYIIEQ